MKTKCSNNLYSYFFSVISLIQSTITKVGAFDFFMSIHNRIIAGTFL